MARLSSEERYKSDPIFAAVVDVLYSMLDRSDNMYTPTELREAAMLAALKYEYTHVRTLTWPGGLTYHNHLGGYRSDCSACILENRLGDVNGLYEGGI